MQISPIQGWSGGGNVVLGAGERKMEWPMRGPVCVCAHNVLFTDVPAPFKSKLEMSFQTRCSRTEKEWRSEEMKMEEDED